jgi:hypothetical protein
MCLRQRAIKNIVPEYSRRQKVDELYFLIFEIFLEKEERRNCFKDIKKELERKFLFFNF